MDMATLGKTGLKVSRLGVGLAEIGLRLTLEDEKQAGRVLNAALDAGINFLDTGECYGISEELIGRSVAHRRGEFILATKTGHVSSGYSGQPWTAQTVRDGIEHSLAKMRTDYLDLVQIHAYDISEPPDEVVRALLDAKEAGKTRFVGYSQENEEAEWAVRSGLFDTLQTAFSLVDQRARYGLFELARSKGMGIVGKRPIGNAVWRIDRLRDDYHNLKVADELLKRAKAMADLGPIPGEPDDAIELALGFVLAHREVDTAIVGTLNPAHMLANVDIVERRLPIAQEVVEELHRRYDRVGREWRSIDYIRS